MGTNAKTINVNGNVNENDNEIVNEIENENENENEIGIESENEVGNEIGNKKHRCAPKIGYGPQNIVVYLKSGPGGSKIF